MATSAPYRQFWKTTSNVSEDRRILGSFTIGSNPVTLGTFVRPSAGSAATSGLGNNFTVTMPSTAGIFLVQLLENVVQGVSVQAAVNLRPVTAGSSGTPPTAPAIGSATFAVAQATAIDEPSASFYIVVTKGDGSALSTATPPTGYTWEVTFEAVIKPTFVPASL